MINIKFEVEEQEETPLPIESINVGFPSDNNVVVAAEVPKKVVPKKNKKPKLDNSTTDSVAAGSRLFETEPAESLSEFTIFQLLNHPSLNIPGLPIPNCSQFQTIDSEFDQSIQQQQQSIPNGTEQQYLLLPKIERIVSEIHQEVLLSLGQCSLIPNGTQQQQHSPLLPKLEPIVSEIQQEVPLSLDQCSSISNSNSMETTTTTPTNCNITTKIFRGPRAGLGRKAKSNVCYSVPMEPNPVSKSSKKEPSSSADNSELTNNDIEQDSASGSISGPNSSASTSASVAVAAPSPRQPVNVTREKPVQIQVKQSKKVVKRRKRLKDSTAQLQRRLELSRQYRRRRRNLLANLKPEQREKRRLKYSERYRRKKERETEEQRELRLERSRQYNRTVGKQRIPKKRETMTPEEREKEKAKRRQEYLRYQNKKMAMLENQQKLRMENEKKLLMENQKMKNSLEKSQIGQSQTSQSMSSSSINLNNSESSVSEVWNLIPVGNRRSRLTILGYPLQC